ncbi:reverse transcriptase, partial [Staphylococcus simiae]
KLKKVLFNPYKIIRYRDDYRIFSNSKEDIYKIAELLNDVLIDLNFKLNSKKTVFSEDIVITSIKKDKIAYQKIKATLYLKDLNGKIHFQLTLQKHLLQILIFSKKYPNTGSVIRMLSEFNKWRTYKIKENYTSKNRNDYIQCISIVLDIMINNTKTIPLCISIISKFIVLLDEKNKTEIIANIKDKINGIPNTDLVNIWLQRLTLNYNLQETFDTDICKLISGEKDTIFDKSWIKTKKYKINDIEIINQEFIKELSPVINNEEVALFNY